MKGIIVKSHIAGKDEITKVAIPNGIATAALTISHNDLKTPENGISNLSSTTD